MLEKFFVYQSITQFRFMLFRYAINFCLINIQKVLIQLKIMKLYIVSVENLLYIFFEFLGCMCLNESLVVWTTISVLNIYHYFKTHILNSESQSVGIINFYPIKTFIYWYRYFLWWMINKSWKSLSWIQNKNVKELVFI